MSNDTNPDESRTAKEIRYFRSDVCLIAGMAFAVAFFYFFPTGEAVKANEALATMIVLGMFISWVFGMMALFKHDIARGINRLREWRATSA